LRVSLDTNVLVSAFTTRGICADVLAVVLAEHQLVLGEKVLAELSRVLVEKMRMPKDAVAEAQAFLREEAAVVSKGSSVGVDIRDPDDADVLAEAVGGLADVLVTGDRDFLDMADQLPIEVLSPRGFWEKLQGAG
jgi:putative PIN family toxin of toxin-antitoxin system